MDDADLLEAGARAHDAHLPPTRSRGLLIAASAARREGLV